jgi:hypothetical protein
MKDLKTASLELLKGRLAFLTAAQVEAWSEMQSITYEINQRVIATGRNLWDEAYTEANKKTEIIR